MKKVNLFIVGAAKAGTTSLYHYLNQHEDIEMLSIKEPNYFSSSDIVYNDFLKEIKVNYEFDLKQGLNDICNLNNELDFHKAYIQSEKEYNCLVQRIKGNRIIGEASTTYLYSKDAAKNIYEYNPNSKIIIILRDPISRAYSHFNMNLQIGLNKKQDFYDDLIYDYSNQNKGWCISNLYIELGMYHDQVKRYIDQFGKDNVKLLFFEDMIKDTHDTVNNITSFLNIKELASFESEAKNISKVPKNRILFNLLKKTYKTLNISRDSSIKNLIKEKLLTQKMKPLLKEDSINFIQEKVREDVRKLSKLIDIDLEKKWISKYEKS